MIGLLVGKETEQNMKYLVVVQLDGSDLNTMTRTRETASQVFSVLHAARDAGRDWNVFELVDGEYVRRAANFKTLEIV